MTRVAAWTGQARKTGPENALDAGFQRLQFRDQALKLFVGDSAAIEARRKPGAGASEDHLRGDEQQRNCEEDARSGRKRQHIDRGKDEEQAAPCTAVELRCELGEAQPVPAILRDDLRQALRERERTFRSWWTAPGQCYRVSPTADFAPARMGAPSAVARAAPSARMRSSSAGSRRSSSRRRTDRRDQATTTSARAGLNAPKPWPAKCASTSSTDLPVIAP